MSPQTFPRPQMPGGKNKLGQTWEEIFGNKPKSKKKPSKKRK